MEANSAINAGNFYYYFLPHCQSPLSLTKPLLSSSFISKGCTNLQPGQNLKIYCQYDPDTQTRANVSTHGRVLWLHTSTTYTTFASFRRTTPYDFLLSFNVQQQGQTCAQVANTAGISEARLRELNPVLTRLPNLCNNMQPDGLVLIIADETVSTPGIPIVSQVHPFSFCFITKPRFFFYSNGNTSIYQPHAFPARSSPRSFVHISDALDVSLHSFSLSLSPSMYTLRLSALPLASWLSSLPFLAASCVWISLLAPCRPSSRFLPAPPLAGLLRRPGYHYIVVT